MIYLLRYLKNLLWPSPEERPIRIWRTFDFTKLERDHWAGYDYGDNYSARFTIRARWPIRINDEMLIRMRSGRIGRYHIYSVKRDFTGVADYKVEATAVRYEPRRRWKATPCTRPMALLSAPKIKALLTDGSGSTRSNSSELPALSSSFVDSTGVMWPLLVRHEACHRRANSLCAGGDFKIR